MAFAKTAKTNFDEKWLSPKLRSLKFTKNEDAENGIHSKTAKTRIPKRGFSGKRLWGKSRNVNLAENSFWGKSRNVNLAENSFWENPETEFLQKRLSGKPRNAIFMKNGNREKLRALRALCEKFSSLRGFHALVIVAARSVAQRSESEASNGAIAEPRKARRRSRNAQIENLWKSFLSVCICVHPC